MQGFKYNVDLVLCIDSTGSMSPIIDRVKKGALDFHAALQRQMEAKTKAIDQLRLRVIAFRDFQADGNDAIHQSDFFRLPEQAEQFSAFVGAIKATGGGDEPENGLEALAIAMKSDWTRGGDKRRHVIVIWSDASTHPIERGGGSRDTQYPAELPRTFDALADMWEGQGTMDRNAKRLIIFAPDAFAWTDIANHWEAVMQHTSKAGDGLSDVDYNKILSAIAESI